MSIVIPKNFSELEALVASEFDLTLEEMRERCRRIELVQARFVFWWLAREKLRYPFARIARFVKRDHTTITSGYGRVRNDPDLMQKALDIAARYPEKMTRAHWG